MDFINSLLPVITNLGFFSYWIVFFVAFLESIAFIGMVVPGAFFITFIGFLSAQGFFDIKDMLWFTALGVIAGDLVSYYLGTKGTHLFKNENKILKLSHLEKGKTFFLKYGNKSVVFGRFVLGLRSIISFVAGLSRMNVKVFLLWDVIGATIWSVFHLYLGYFFGGAFRNIEYWSTRAGIFLLILLIVITIIGFLIKTSHPLFIFLKSVIHSIKIAILSNPDVRKLLDKHPKFFKFLEDRLRRRRFSGLPFTILTLFFIYVVFLFIGIIKDVLFYDPIIAADIRIENLLYVFRDPDLIKIFTWITLLGKFQIVLMAGLIFSILLFLWEKKSYILPFWFTILGSELFAFIAKIAINRPRPDGALPVYIEDSSSFPSGHATIAAALYGFLTYFFFKNIRKRKNKINIFFLGVVIILLIGLSRLYLGVHFLSDVIGGYLIGFLWLIAAITITEWALSKKDSMPFKEPFHIRVKLITSFLIFLGFIFFIIIGVYYKPKLNLAATNIDNQVIAGDIINTFKDNKLSRYSETLTGVRQEPLSFIISASDDDKLLEIFKGAGWYLADPVSFGALFKIAKAIILNVGYPTAPMAPSFWNSKVNDFGFEKPTDLNTVRERHHARFWKTNLKTQDEKNIYLGIASLDIGIKWAVAHKIRPDIDTERDFVLNDFLGTGLVLDSKKVQFVDPDLGKNFSGDQFFTDGQLYVINL